MSPAEALAVAARSQPEAPTIVPDGDPSGLKAGAQVVVTADDTGRDPIQGTLLAADAQELVIRSAHPRVGEINIHFPRTGFDVVAARPS
jgi:glutathione S-transferase